MDNKRQRGAAYGGASLAGFPSWSVSVIDACHTDEQRCYRMAVAVLIDRDDRGGGLTVHERFPAKIMGNRLRYRRDDRGVGHGARPAGGRLAVRPARRVLVALCRVIRDRYRGRIDPSSAPSPQATAKRWCDTVQLNDSPRNF